MEYKSVVGGTQEEEAIQSGDSTFLREENDEKSFQGLCDKGKN
jgi:hypothetical protein